MAKAKAKTKEDSSALLDKIRANAGLAFLLGMGLLLGIRVLLYMVESNPNISPDVKPNEQPFKQSITDQTVEYLLVNDMLAPWPSFQQSEIFPLGQINMFDAKTVQNEAVLEQRANQLVRQARDAQRAGNLRQALDLVKQALVVMENHYEGRQLLEEIQQQLDAAENAATTGTTTRAPVENLSP